MAADALCGRTLGHYRVLDRLGSGGMGMVYRAEDVRLARAVALKVLHDQDEEAAGRLTAEARAASTLTHPGIAVVYEVGHVTLDAERIDYIAMEYVEGTTLAARATGAPLDVTTALDIVEQAAGALEEAHRRGIVHRDLKPANVMITPPGRVKILDFGVAARRARAHASPDEETRTADADDAAGFVGTLPYVAPEQATGRPVDGRADVFSLGVILYELVTGRRPFEGTTTAQRFESLLTGTVPPLVLPVPDPRQPQIERLVRRMLARDPAHRISSGDVREGVAAIRSGSRLPDAAGTDATSNVLIGAFSNISGNPEDEWLGTGLAETLGADAGQIEHISVIPRERVSEMLRTLAQQTGEPADRLVLRAARDLGARWAVGGAFQRSGDLVRITASVTEVETGQIVRMTKVDGQLSAIFELQDRLVRELATLLREALAPAAAQPRTEVVGAYEAFSRGVLNRRADTFESLDRAVTLFERAVSLDPSYGRAYTELGAALSTKADYLSMPDLNVRALSSLRRAIELLPQSPRAWRELGSTLVGLGQDAEGMAALRRAVDLDPDDPSTCGAMGRALFIGFAKFREAAGWFDCALARNPQGGWYALQLAHCAALLREFERGERAADRAVALEEAFLSGREGLFFAGAYIRAGHLAALQGRHEQAVEYFEREIDFLVRTDHPLKNRILVELNTRLGGSYLRLGDRQKAQRVLDVAIESFDRRVRMGADDPFTRYYASAVHAQLGDAEPALALLERAIAERPAFTAARAAIEPEFEAIRTDPRFQRLVQAVA